MTQIEIFSNLNCANLQENVNEFLSEVSESGGKVLDVKFQDNAQRMSVMVVYEDEE